MMKTVRKTAFVVLLILTFALGSCGTFSEASHANIDITVQTAQQDQGGSQ
jgi:hypothetical protein